MVVSDQLMRRQVLTANPTAAANSFFVDCAIEFGKWFWKFMNLSCVCGLQPSSLWQKYAVRA
jgi:hypothetical protein